MGDSFTHLHQHTEFSMLDGAARVKEVVAAAAADGQPALGITDHGNMYGVLDFYAECRKQGINPIIGIEAYMAHDSRFEKPSRRGRVDDSGGEVDGGKKLYYHLCLLAESNEGYRNLIKLSSEAFLSGYHYKPRCMIMGQEIVTATGARPIEEIRVGDQVMTHRGRLRRVLQTMSRPFRGTLYGVRLDDRHGRVTWMTGEHPVLVRTRGGALEWVEVQHLVAGRSSGAEQTSTWQSFACLPKPKPDRELRSIRVEDFIGPEWVHDGSRLVETSRRSTAGATRHDSDLEPEIVLDHDFGFLVGLYAADGHTVDGEVRFSLHEDDPHLIDACRLAIKRLTGEEVTVAGRPERPGDRGVDVRVSSAPLARLLEALCGRGADEKHLPAFVFEAPRGFRTGALLGVLEGDGADQADHWVVTQTSRDLAWQVRHLAAELSDSFPSPLPHHDGNPAHATQYRMTITKPEHDGHRRCLADDDYVYRPIAEILTKDYEGTVYNIEVEEDHSYVSDFAIHNCDWDLLERHSAGVIATTGCLGGHVLQSLLRGDEQGALEKAARLQDIFGRDNLFVELQDHGIPEQKRTNPQLLEIARQLRAPLLATNDSHYVHREDAVAHDALLCVQTNSTIDDPNRFKFSSDEHYLKTAQEMRYLFSELPESCDNTLWIAERCNVEIEFGKPKLPSFPLPEGFTSDGDYLRHLTYRGAEERWGAPLPPHIVERLDYELGVIEHMGFSSYFLIVWDLIDHARRSGIRVGPGRGSAAGCAVAYTLRITDLDPIKYDLLFERFLNPSRISMPDIDMDFDDRFRDEMIRYAAERYGRDHVAQIVTFSTIKARAAVRDAARVLGYPYAVGDRVAKAMPPLVMGRDTPLYACLEEHPKYEDGFKAAAELREMYAVDPDVKKVVDVAKGLEGLRRGDGIHAAAVVITDEPLTEYLPIQRKPEAGKDIEDAPIVTQYEMHGVEDLGLLKMDFLGLRNLSVIENALDLIEASTGERPDIDAVPLDDHKTYELLQRGDSIGVFQLEGGPMRALMRSLAPTGFEDVAALVALYRPGPMAANMHNDYADRKNGRQPISYLHPDLEEVLGDTYGLMIYQESVMRVAQKVAGYSLAEADNLRKACFPAGTRILTKSRGYVPIEKLLSLADRRVQTIDTTSCTSRYEPVEDVWSVGVKPVFRLTTSTGYEIEATANHPFLVEGAWRELGDIRPGDLVGVAGRTTTDGGSRVTDAEVDLAALLISEGYTPDVRVESRRPFFCNTDPELLETFRRAYAAQFGRPHEAVADVAGVTRLWLTKGELLELEPALGSLGTSAHKVIPNRILNAPRHKVERFLGLYFCADGWSDRSGVHFGSKSRAVCLGLKRLLLRCGILSNLHSRDIPGHGRHWTLSIADKAQAKAFALLVQPHLTELKAAKVDRWLGEWGERCSATNIGIPASFLADELARRQAVTGRSKRDLGVDTGGYTRSKVLHRETLNGLLYSERLEDLRTGDLVWDTVVSIEPVGERECFDFCMANPERPYAVVEDFLAHNCGKKIRELIAKEREKFVQGCEESGYGAQLGTALFDIIEPFADYAFNKSHAYGYGLVSYQTAWLKANYPVEYLAALLTSVKDNQDKAAVYLNECRAKGITVQVPDVNRSMSDFSVAEDDGRQVILFGLSAVRNVGEGLVAFIIQERANGPYADFHDFCNRVDPQVLNKRTIESLIKAGAFDSLGHERLGLLKVHELIIDRTLARRRKEAEGQFDLFASVESTATPVEAPIAIPDDAFDKMTRLNYEKEMLGLYVSDHPLMGVEHQVRRKADATIAELRDAGPNAEAGVRTVGGVVTGLQRKYTKKGELMAIFVLEDLEAAMEVMVFPKTMIEHGSKLADDRIVCVKGRLDTRDDLPKLVAMEIIPVEVVEDAAAPPLRLQFPAHGLDEGRIEVLKKLLVSHPGPSPVLVNLGTQTIRLSDEFRVDESNGLRAELLAEFGAAALLP